MKAVAAFLLVLCHLAVTHGTTTAPTTAVPTTAATTTAVPTTAAPTTAVPTTAAPTTAVPTTAATTTAVPTTAAPTTAVPTTAATTTAAITTAVPTTAVPTTAATTTAVPTTAAITTAAITTAAPTTAVPTTAATTTAVPTTAATTTAVPTTAATTTAAITTATTTTAAITTAVPTTAATTTAAITTAAPTTAAITTAAPTTAAITTAVPTTAAITTAAPTTTEPPTAAATNNLAFAPAAIVPAAIAAAPTTTNAPTTTAAWTCVEAPRRYDAYQVDAGNGMVVLRSKYGNPYFLIGSYWQRLGYTRLTHVTVGPAGLWGSYGNRVYKYIAGNFVSAYGQYMLQVDAGGDDQIVGATSSSYAYCLKGDKALGYKGVGSLSWNSLSVRVRHYSCSPKNGCWAVDRSYRVYFTQTVTSACARTGWVYVSGISMRTVEVGTDGSVFGVTTNGRVFQRTGISSSHPSGTTWTSIPSCMLARSVSYDLGNLWVVTNSGFLLKCRQ